MTQERAEEVMAQEERQPERKHDGTKPSIKEWKK